VTEDGGRWRGAARDNGELIVSTGRQGRGEEAASDHPHHNAKLLECLLDGGERRYGERPKHGGNGGSGSFGRLGFLGQEAAATWGEELGHGAL
jgi:hypothetical protein